MASLAREAGVSKNAVSLALRNDPQVSLPVRRRIQALAEQLGYNKNPVVSELMSQLRTGAATGYKATLAILNASEDPEAFRNHPTASVYVEGCQQRARQQGYHLDEFWLADPMLDGRKLSSIFRSRGIRGALIIGMVNGNQLPQKFQKIWQDYPCVVAGLRTSNPVLPFACTDYYNLVNQAVQQALHLGYQRLGLVVDAKFDQLIEGRFSAGMYAAQLQLPLGQRVPPFYTTASATGQEAAFRAWFAETRPEVILTDCLVVATWLGEMRLRVPEDVGLIQLNWHQDRAQCAGMNQNNDLVGFSVVSMLLHMIHGGQRNSAGQQYSLLTNGRWKEGKTVRRVRPTPCAVKMPTHLNLL